MRAFHAAALLTTALVLGGLLQLALSDAKPITLEVRPRFAFAPADVRILIRLQTNPAHREVRVVADGDAFYRESRWDVEGDRAPRLFEVLWYALPAGQYRVRADVASRTAILATDEQTIEVVGP